jgi:hypothetical protein
MNEQQTNGAVLQQPIARKVRKDKGKKRAPSKRRLKPNLPPLDSLAAAQEACRHAQEGNVRLSRTVDLLREGLQTLPVAEWDRELNVAVSPAELRKMAQDTLSAAGFPPRAKVVHSRAGKADHDLTKNHLNDGEDYD